MKFTKMQGTGNDFIMFNGFLTPYPDNAPALTRQLCDRHFGIGADGAIWVLPSDRADARMRILNADGSEAEMCGNGLRCAARFLRDEGILSKDTMTIDTLAGIKTATLCGENVSVNMGAPCLDPQRIPVLAPSNIVAETLDGQPCRFFCVSMGNPHAVTFDLWPDDDAFARLGPMMESHPLFPAKSNIEFCRMTENGIDVRVWERGAGPTLACGTGSCAVFAAARAQGLISDSANIHLPGGILRICQNPDGTLTMTGSATSVYTGIYNM